MYGTVTDRRCIIGFKRKCRSHPVTYVPPLSFFEPVVNPFALKLFGHRRSLNLLERKEARTMKSFNKIQSTFIIHYLPTRKITLHRIQKKHLYINVLCLIVFILRCKHSDIDICIKSFSLFNYSH